MSDKRAKIIQLDSIGLSIYGKSWDMGRRSELLMAVTNRTGWLCCLTPNEVDKVLDYLTPLCSDQPVGVAQLQLK